MSKIYQFTAIIILGSFIILWANQAVFTHSHMVDNQMVIHAHPYQQNEDSLPDHQHSAAEFIFYAQLVQILFLLIPGFTIVAVLQLMFKFELPHFNFIFKNTSAKHWLNKAPPLC